VKKMWLLWIFWIEVLAFTAYTLWGYWQGAGGGYRITGLVIYGIALLYGLYGFLRFLSRRITVAK